MKAFKTPGVASSARVTLPEQHPQVIPEMAMVCDFSFMLLPRGRLFSNYSSNGFHHRNKSELPTTLTEDNDIAAAAKAGGSKKPVNGSMRPMANGMPIKLYVKAQPRLV